MNTNPNASKALEAKFRLARACFWKARGVQGGSAAATLKAKDDMVDAYAKWKKHDDAVWTSSFDA